jgi:NADPH:quinone reductase
MQPEHVTLWLRPDPAAEKGEGANSSGPAPPIAPLELSKRGSLYLTRPTMFDYTRARAALMKATQELFHLVGRGVIGAQIGQTFALRDAAQAHRALEARQTKGSTVLLP